MVAKIKVWFLGLKTWQKIVVGFITFSLAVSPFTGGGSNDVGGGETSVPTVAPTEMTATPTPAPTATPTPTQTTILAESGCRNVWEAIGDGSSATIDWGDSIITDDDLVKVLQDDVIDDLTVAQYIAETVVVKDWLQESIVKMKQARVTLIETYNYNKVSNLIVKALLNLSEGMDVYCAGYTQ